MESKDHINIRIEKRNPRHMVPLFAVAFFTIVGLTVFGKAILEFIF